MPSVFYPTGAPSAPGVRAAWGPLITLDSFRTGYLRRH